MKFFVFKNEQKKCKIISPNLLTKTGIFFLAALVFRVPEQVDFKTNKSPSPPKKDKTKKKEEGFPLFV